MSDPQPFNPDQMGRGYLPTPTARLIRGLWYAQPPHYAAQANLNQVVYLNSRTALENQGQLGACVGHGVTSAAECLESPLAEPEELSRRWVWQTAKNRMGVTGNVGVYIDYGCDVALAGIPLETDVPYEADVADVVLPAAPLLARTISAHALITGDVVAGVWAAIASGQPVVIGVSMGTDGFYAAMNNGLLVRDKGVNNDFGHCLWAWGVTPDFVLTRNSWGDMVGPTAPLCSPLIGPGDVAFTHAAFRACCDEARAFVPVDVSPLPPPPPPTIDTAGYDRAVDVVRRTRAELADIYAANMRSTATRYKLAGMDDVVVALQAARDGGA